MQLPTWNAARSRARTAPPPPMLPQESGRSHTFPHKLRGGEKAAANQSAKRQQDALNLQQQRVQEDNPNTSPSWGGREEETITNR